MMNFTISPLSERSLIRLFSPPVGGIETNRSTVASTLSPNDA